MGTHFRTRGARFVPTPKGHPQARVYAPQDIGDPMKLGTWLYPEPGD